ncbi:MAG TPA: LamG domain-containing protein, partial [Polyangiaceae bacterium]|nr:LamG domain-containing protein [Polyangiaceae bacterium]
PAAEAPIVGMVTPEAQADESVILQGQALTAESAVWMYTQTTTGNGAVVQLPILQRRPDEGLTALIPDGTPNGMLLLWVQNESGVSYPVRINATEAHWVGPRYGAVGSTIAIYGRNLTSQPTSDPIYANGANDGTSHVYLRPWGSASAPSVSAAVTSANPYKVTFTVPGGLANANYEVWIHNGHGGDFGWSGPLKLEVKEPHQWQEPLNVSDLDGDGISGACSSDPGCNSELPPLCCLHDVTPNLGVDVEPAIQAIVDAVPEGTSLEFPAGTYVIGQPIHVTKPLRFMGAGSGDTIFQELDTTAGPEPAGSLVTIKKLPFKIEGLTLEATVPDRLKQLLLSTAQNEEDMQRGLVIHGVTFKTPSDSRTMGVYIDYSEDVYIQNCVFECGRAIDTKKVAQLFVQDNEFLGNTAIPVSEDPQNCVEPPDENNRITAVRNNSVQQFDYSRNSMASAARNGDATDPRGRYMGRALVFQTQSGLNKDLFVGSNHITNVGALLESCDSNVGENILSEPTGAQVIQFQGSPTSIVDTTFTFALSAQADELVTDEQPGWNGGQKSASILYVNTGPGAGQWRKIVDNSATSLTIDRPFDVPVSLNDTVSVVHSTTRATVWSNDFNNLGIDDNENGTPDYLESGFDLDNPGADPASVAVQFWGSSNDAVIARNRVVGYRGGVSTIGLAKDPCEDDCDSECPCGTVRFFTSSGALIASNRITQGRGGSSLQVRLKPDADDFATGPALGFNGIVRNGELSDLVASGGRVAPHDPSGTTTFGWLQNSVVEGNRFTDVNTGFFIGKFTRQTMLRNNQFESTSLEPEFTAIDIDPDATDYYLPGNTVTGTVGVSIGHVADDRDLIAHWSMDEPLWEAEPRTVAESSKNSFDGEPLGFANSASPPGETPAGRHGGAGFFDGSELHQTVKLPYPIDLRSFTVSSWFKIDGYDSDYSGAGEHYYLFGSSGIASGGISTYQGGGIGFFIGGGIVFLKGSQGSTASNLWWDVRDFRSDGEWHHVAVTYDEVEGVARLYGDGAERDSYAVTLGTVRPQVPAQLSANYFIGSRGTGHFFNGGVDDVHLWNRALTAAEIRSIWDGLIAHWKLDEPSWLGAPNEVLDSSFSRGHLDATSRGATSVPGHSGNAALFDGTDDTIELPSLGDLETFSISAWFRIDAPTTGSNSNFVFASSGIGSGGISTYAGRGIGFFMGGGLIFIKGTEGSTGSGLWWDVSGFVGQGTWHHVAITYDGSTVLVYGDGALKDSMTVDLGVVRPESPSLVPTKWFLGSRNRDYFNGAIDEVKIWDRAISQAAVLAEFNGN